jgi:hypothetical protein
VSSSSLFFICQWQSISAILAEQRPSSTGRHHPPWRSAKVVLDRPPWSGDIILWQRHWRDGLIRGWRPGRSATIFHEQWQQSDILVRE